MRMIVRWCVVTTLVLSLLAVALAIAATVGIVHGGWLDGASWSIDGVDLPTTFAGFGLDGFGTAVVAATVAGLLFVGLAIGLFAVLGVLASLVLIVPLALAALFALVAGAVLVGLAPMLVPLLLVVGACVLLARLARRRRPGDLVSTPSPHA